MPAKKIRKNRNINGIMVNNTETKLSQFADDTTLIIDGLACLQTFDIFYDVSGLKLNDKKTEGLWIGSKCGSNEILFPVKALGVWLSVDPE